MGVVFCFGFKINGVPEGGNGGGSVSGWLKYETISHLYASDLEVVNAKQASNKSIPKVRAKEEAFCFRMYFYTPRGIIKP